MILTLEVMGQQAQNLGAAKRKVFNAIGGTIGRLPDNDWVFPDPYVSGRHALIRYLNGRFFVEDTSTNGVFVNSPDSRLSKTQAHQLKNGDVLFIDAYQIAVSIENEPVADAAKNDPLAVLQGHAERSPRKGDRRDGPSPRMAPPEELIESADPMPGEEDRTAAMPARRLDEGRANETQWFRMSEMADPPPKPRNETQWFGASEMSAPEPPAPVRPKVVAARPQHERPASRAVLERSPGAPKKAPAAPRNAAASDDSNQLGQLLAAAGVQGVEPSDELAQTCGEMLRVAVGGLMEVLRSREQLKDELHIRSTTFKASNNNPLKFSANTDDAFHNLLVRQNSAYLEPTEAFAEALQDVRDHQTAVLTAMRLAFETMLAKFDPNRLQDDFDRQMKKGSILGVPAKLRYWDLYRDRYADLAKDAEASFQTLFGAEFAKAYEEQIERLKSRGRR